MQRLSLFLYSSTAVTRRTKAKTSLSLRKYPPIEAFTPPIGALSGLSPWKCSPPFALHSPPINSLASSSPEKESPFNMFTTLFRAVLVALVASLAYAFLPSHVNSAVFSPAVATLTHSSSVSLPRIVAAALATSSRNNDCNCSKCKGTGALNCIPCKGTGIDKVNGNVFER